MKKYDEWTVDELLVQERGNFSGTMAVCLKYLLSKGQNIDEFIEYSAAQFLEGWREEAQNIEDFMDGVLLNIKANGGEIFNYQKTEKTISASASYLLNGSILAGLGCPIETGNKYWDKFSIIADELNMHFEWSSNGEDKYAIKVWKE